MRGIKIDVTRNGWLVQPDIAAHNLPVIADMQCAETVDALLLIVQQWARDSVMGVEGVPNAMHERE